MKTLNEMTLAEILAVREDVHSTILHLIIHGRSRLRLTRDLIRFRAAIEREMEARWAQGGSV